MTAESLKVAVIGGGAAGLAAARVLSRNGLTPVVLEKDKHVGGVWRHVVGSKTRPMYKGLRTNLPRELMAFREKPWGNGVGQSYVTHEEVLNYLCEYERDFNLEQYIVLGSEVTQLKMLEDEVSKVSTRYGEEFPKIELQWEGDGTHMTQKFDAVCVANGHYAAPSSPVLPGIENFKGRSVHSIEYDDPADFEKQRVLCIGGRASGADLAREISLFAEHVYLSDSTAETAKSLGNVTLVPRTLGIAEDGTVKFGHGCTISPMVDAIVYCTGYDYSFPFINEESNLNLIVQPGERRVSPLFQQLWHAVYPNLSFVGLPHSVLPFPLFELQLEAIVHEWKEQKLPTLKERLEQAELDANRGGAKKSGLPKDTHYLGSGQWDYCRDMAKHADLYDDVMENYIATNQEIWDHSGAERKGLFPGGPDIYRRTRYERTAKSFAVLDSLIEANEEAVA